MRIIFAVIIFTSAAATGSPTAQMELPDELATVSERIPISGFGGYNKGRFQLQDYDGDFTRSESRLGLLNSAYVSNSGKSSFTLRDATSTDLVSAECHMAKKAVTIDVVTFDPKKMTYQCEFRRGGEVLGARLAIGQPKAKGFKERLLAKDVRRGESNIFDKHLFIDSVHKYQGSKLTSSAPIGYVLTHDGRAAAARELTDINPTLFIAAGVAGDLRHSVMSAALALAVLRDPANSALEE